MTLPIKSAKTAKEMLEAVCEDLVKHVDGMRVAETRAGDARDYEYAVYFKYRAQFHEELSDRYRAILKEME